VAETNPKERAEAEADVKNRIQQFLDLYRFLPVEHKAQLQGAVDAYCEGQDKRTRELYKALFAAARDGKGPGEALSGLMQADPGIQTDASGT